MPSSPSANRPATREDVQRNFSEPAPIARQFDRSSCGPLSWPLYDETLGKPGGNNVQRAGDGVAEVAGRAVKRQIARALLAGHGEDEVFTCALVGGQRELSPRPAFKRH